MTCLPVTVTSIKCSFLSLRIICAILVGSVVAPPPANSNSENKDILHGKTNIVVYRDSYAESGRGGGE